MCSFSPSLAVLGPDSLPGLREAWNELADHCPGHYLSQTWRWATAAWKTVAAPNGHELRILTLREGDRLVAVWPLVVHRRAGLRIVRALSSESSEYTSPLSEAGAQRRARVFQLFRAAEALGDVLVLKHLRADDPLADVVRRQSLRCFRSNLLRAPWIARTDYGAWADYLSTVRGSHLASLHRKRRKLVRKGKLGFERHQAPGDALIESLLAHKASWMVRRGLTNAWLGRPQYRAFLMALSSGGENRDGLTLFSLELDGRPIALQLKAVVSRAVV